MHMKYRNLPFKSQMLEINRDISSLNATLLFLQSINQFLKYQLNANIKIMITMSMISKYSLHCMFTCIKLYYKGSRFMLTLYIALFNIKYKCHALLLRITELA